MEKIITFEITQELDGFKAEHILKKQLGFSEKLVGKLKRCEGSVLLNDEAIKLVERVKMGDILRVTISEDKAKNIPPSDIPLDILYEDEDVILLNKPRSMPTHPVRNHRNDTLANGVINYLGESKFHVITRLDKNTSGIVLVAKNRVAAAFLTEEIKKGRIEKEYIALVNGELHPEKGKISAPIKKKSEKGIARCVSPEGKEAVTLYETVEKKENLSIVRLRPLTGRTHQLRVHMSCLGCPIYGDSMYGAMQQGERTRLHCEKVSFCHPMTKRKITIKAPVPKDMKKGL